MTATANPPAIVQPVASTANPARTCAVYLRISGEVYAARCVRTVAGKTWKLRSPQGRTYEVCRGADGFQCDCWEGVACWTEAKEADCVHALALRASGLLD